MVEHPQPTTLSNILLGTGALGGILWAVYEKLMRYRVEKASNGASVAMAEGQETLFSLMSQRLALLEREVSSMREELDKERDKRRLMEEYVFRLQDAMRAHNVPVPALIRKEDTPGGMGELGKA